MLEMNLKSLLKFTINQDANELHLAPGAVPHMRRKGELVGIDMPPLNQNNMREILNDNNMLGDSKKSTCLQAETSIVFSFSISGLGRFRANIYRQRGTNGATIRVLPFEIPTIETIGLSEKMGFIKSRNEELTSFTKGLVLISGSGGTGKSTSLAALVDHFNSNKVCHIDTIENPIEYLYTHKKSIVTQREIGTDVKCLESAIKAAKSKCIDIIAIDELPNNEESVMLAVTAAEDFLVLATLKTQPLNENLVEYLRKIIGDNELNMKRLSNVLRVNIYQDIKDGTVKTKIAVDPFHMGV